MEILEKEKVLIHKRLSTHTSPDVISKELISEHNARVSESTIYCYTGVSHLPEIA